jgi:hypothetical protein
MSASDKGWVRPSQFSNLQKREKSERVGELKAVLSGCLLGNRSIHAYI